MAATVCNMLPSKFEYWNYIYVNCLAHKGTGPAHLLWPQKFFWCKMRADMPWPSFFRGQARLGPTTPFIHDWTCLKSPFPQQQFRSYGSLKLQAGGWLTIREYDYLHLTTVMCLCNLRYAVQTTTLVSSL